MCLIYVYFMQVMGNWLHLDHWVVTGLMVMLALMIHWPQQYRFAAAPLAQQHVVQVEVASFGASVLTYC